MKIDLSNLNLEKIGRQWDKWIIDLNSYDILEIGHEKNDIKIFKDE